MTEKEKIAATNGLGKIVEVHNQLATESDPWLISLAKQLAEGIREIKEALQSEEDE